MKSLKPPDKHYLEAAKGWCELRNYLEANEELEKIAPKLRAHPLVLEVRWIIYANLNRWDGAVEIARALVKSCPDLLKGYTFLALSLQKLNRNEEAYEVMNKALPIFPTDEIVYYRLGIICCAMGKIEETRSWLSKAIELGGDGMKMLVLHDPDLERIWKDGRC